MTDSAKLREEVADIADGEGLDVRMVMALAGDRTLNARESLVLERIKAEHGASLYGEILYVLTRRAFPTKQAEQLWHDIANHRAEMAQKLGRDVGIVVSTHDYLANKMRLLRNICLIEESKLEQLASVATRDGLTGLVDQTTFKLQLKDELERVKRYDGVVSLIMLDLDHFKQVNDNFGHSEGDVVLQRLAEVINSQIRSLDTAARYGGEEFAIILPEADLDAATALAERLRTKVMETFAGGGYKVTISAGVASFAASSNEGAGEMIKRADTALYRAKEEGRNRVVTA